jgi:glycosyltransferase involved in cell wall biosynthesis
MLLSVLMPSLDSAAYFERAVDSVLSQKVDFDLQVIVVDGGSHDGTLKLLKSIRDPRVQWVSEADNGQSAAINKGLAMARGQVISWLNCDDIYLPGALAMAMRTFEENPKAQWLVGRCNIIDKAGRVIRHNITNYKDRLLHSFSYRALLRMNMISQPAVFWRRSFGEQVGPLDESLNYTMDYDLWLRMAQRSQPLILNQTLASFRVHRTSKSRGGHRAQFAEGYRVACRYCNGDRVSRFAHRLNVEKIVLGYSAMRLIGM